MRALFPCLLVLFVACGKGGDARNGDHGQNPHETTKNFFKSSDQLIVQVAYEPGAEPYVGAVSPANPFQLWQLLDENLHALFQGRSGAPSITVPKTLAEFQAIPAQARAEWKVDDLLDLAKEHRVGQSSSSRSYFWIVFLKGNFHNGDAVQPGTVGLSIGGTTVLAIFKDVVESTGQGQGPLMAELVPRYVEQSTLVHEMGHALGLVDNGLPLKSSHQDSAHGAHCGNPNCVMYWLNEGKSDMVGFVQQMITNQSVVMYDQACLEDARKY